MIKFKYVLIAKGIRKSFRLRGGVIDCNHDVPYYSNTKTILGEDEDVARFQIREKFGRKWTGFMLIPDGRPERDPSPALLAYEKQFYKNNLFRTLGAMALADVRIKNFIHTWCENHPNILRLRAKLNPKLLTK